MGQYDSIKAVASAGYTQPAEYNFKTNNLHSTPITLNRLPGESDSAYLYRLTAIQNRQKSQQGLDNLIRYKKEKLEKQKAYEEKLRQENDNFLLKKFNAIEYNPNDPKSIQEALAKLASVGIDYTYMMTGDFDAGELKKSVRQAELELENLKNGEENSKYMTRYDNKRNNTAAFEFQNVGSRDFLS